jgi:hypothetical protein
MSRNAAREKRERLRAALNGDEDGVANATKADRSMVPKVHVDTTLP